MGRYIEVLGELLGQNTARMTGAVLYGENINNGSRISGLTKKLQAPPGGRILNVGDSEYSHVGIGFGMMLNGVSSALFAKQLDFMLLGAEHMVSTYNAIRARPPPELGSFTIVCIVCDQGLQGPQSSANAAGDVASLARVPVYTLNNGADTARILPHVFSQPGFRMVCLSQRRFGDEVDTPEILDANPDATVVQYTRGNELTIVAYNFSYPEARRLETAARQRGLGASVFTASYCPDPDWSLVLSDAARTGRLVVLDDSKSVHTPAFHLVDAAREAAPSLRCAVLHRTEAEIRYGVDADRFRFDPEHVLDRLVGPGRAAS